MNKAFIGLGSNIEPRKKYLDDAIRLLNQHEEIEVVQQSSIYETAPVGYDNQDAFLNMVLEIDTTLSNVSLLEVCQGIEQELGRERTIKNGPRTADLDILLYNNENRELEKLRIPHPRMHERAFVLVPLCEIAPEQVMPTDGKLVEDLYNRLSDKELRGVKKWDGTDNE